MPLVWASLALSMLLATIGAVVAFRRGLTLWRDFKRTAGALAAGLDDVSRKAQRTAERADAFGAAAVRMERPTARLRVSLAGLAVLRAAVQDVQHAAGRLTAVYPRK